ncbi:hypothetical protein [Tunturiibacter gelidiferens]|uniref:hypothetical protein n=1 Tax=Tunturiibacter gelidiferens TaxID=3069689 RepID=UPI003D9BE0D3
MTDLSRLFQNAFTGRAVLFAGQDLEPGTSERFLQALSNNATLPPNATMEGVCSGIVDPEYIIAAAKAVEEKTARGALRRIADIPWAAVFTSALDDTLSTELAGQDSQGRRLRHLSLDDEMPAFFPRRNEVLTVLHLSHLANEKTTTGLPLYGRNWGRAKRLLMPGVLGNLAQAIGPAHLLCIAGIRNTDAVAPLLVADSISDLDPDNVYWFVGPQDNLDLSELKLAAPNIHFVESEFSAALTSYSDSASKQSSLSVLKEQVLQLEDLTVTVSLGEIQKVLTFRASELREFRRHLLIVPDLKAKAAAPETNGRKQDFIRFLSQNRDTPDWSGISEGYAFQRDAYKDLLELVLDRTRLIVGSGQRSHTRKRTVEDLPIFLAGPPASGRTVGLSWLAYELRRRGIFVVHLLPAGGTVDNGSIEQILRLAEGRGAPSAVVLLDKSDRKVAEQLDRQLKSAGRRAMLVASVAPAMAKRGLLANHDLDDELEASRGIEVNLDYALTESEANRFRTYLIENVRDIDPDLVLRLLASDPAVFALLYRLIPDTRENIRGVVVDEYLSLVDGLATFRPPTGEQLRGSTMSEQLSIWLGTHRTKPTTLEASAESQQSPSWKNIAIHLPQLVLLFSSLDESISLNLLTKRFPGLLHVYRTIRETLEASGLFQEIDLGKQSDLGLTAANPFVAQLLLNAAVPSSVARIKLLGSLLREFPWDPDSRPVDLPEQALLIHLIRSIAPPSGAFQADYQRTEDLNALADILRGLREDNGAALPQLLLVEGIVLRHLGRRTGDDGRNVDAIAYYRQSRHVLELARESLARRRPSSGRNFEMSMVLNAIATTIGYTFNAESRGQDLDESERRDLVQQALDTASESRAYTDAYHPLDTAFWTSRDFFRHLSEGPETERGRQERERALLNMADAVDKAKELGQLPHDQADRLGSRIVELATYLNDDGTAQLRAEEDAQAGKFSGICLLGRMDAIDSQSGKIISSAAATAALHRLNAYAPKILADDRALTLMHRLWLGAHLGNRDLDERPHGIASTQAEWKELEMITAGRRQLLGRPVCRTSISGSRLHSPIKVIYVGPYR